MKKAIVIGLCLILSFIVGAVIPAAITAALYLSTPDPEAEYYRAMYDVCVAQTRQREMCLESVARFRAKGWYGQDSPGYEWPLPSPAGDEAQPSRGYPAEQQAG